MAVPLLNGKQQFLDANGVSLGLGTVTLYVPGTTTPKASWQDAEQTTLNTSPTVDLDASGYAKIYGSGAYRQIVKDSLGNTIWDQEAWASDYQTLTLPTGASQIGYTQGGTGAVTRTVQAKLRDIVTPQDVGVGVDGESLGIGTGVLQSNTSGIRNTGYGFHALQSNTSGSENTAFGYRALAVAVGGVDPIGSYNTAFGSNALGLMTTGYKNTAVGRDSSDNLTTGYNNTSLGYGSFHLASTAINSVAVGFEAVHGGATGPVTAQGLTGIGFRALYECLTGDFNTAVGTSALANTTTGARNTAVGVNGLNANATGSDSTALGYFAGLTNTGSGNIFVGSGADATAGRTNVTVVAVGVQATTDNTFYLGSNQDVVPGANAQTIGRQTKPWLAGFFSNILYAFTGTAPPAGGTTGSGILLSSTPNLGVFFGSGVPTLSAARGSWYMRTDGSSTSTRMYINTDGGTTWTNVVTAA